MIISKPIAVQSRTRESKNKSKPSRRTAHLRAMLTQELEGLTEKLDAQATAMIPESNGESDTADLASTFVGQSNLAATERLLQGKKQEVERALARLEEGTYGLCSHCGVEIPEERLMVMPSALLCIDCARRRVPGRAN